MEIMRKGLDASYVRYKLAEAGWTTFQILVRYLEHEKREWKLIIGKDVENVDCTYVINDPDEEGVLRDYFMICDGMNYIEEQKLDTDIQGLIKFLNEKYPNHEPIYPLKRKRRNDK